MLRTMARKMTTSGKKIKDGICSSPFTAAACGCVAGTVGYVVGKITFDAIYYSDMHGAYQDKIHMKSESFRRKRESFRMTMQNDPVGS